MSAADRHTPAHPSLAQQTLEQLIAARIVPVVRTRSTETAARASDWLGEAGLTALEITLTVPDAPALIARLVARDGLCVGAGTVLDADQARACIDVGSRFVVSPCIVPEVAAVCHKNGILYLPGILTPTELRTAVEMGAPAVKVFPASSIGGPGHLKALRSVFPDVLLMPTGGIDAGTVAAYFAAGAACVGMGGKLMDEAALERGDRDAIIAAARQALDAIGGAKR